MSARERALAAVSPQGRVGVEIGPLNRPLIRREDGEVLYADHLSTEDLARKYAGHAGVDRDVDPGGGAEAGDLVPVDLVLDGRTLAEALGPRAPVDYVVASHVLEHIPDPIGWLREVADALREGGIVFLALPDKRFTFDFRRAPSTTGDLVGHFLAGARVASPAQVFEYLARSGEVDRVGVWAGRGRPKPAWNDAQMVSAWGHAASLAAKGEYVDAHCTVYTPWSFLDVFGEIVALDLIPYEIAAIEPTAPRELEFFVTLRRRAQATRAERAAATPLLDPRLHHDLPGPTRWRDRLSLVARAFRAALAPARHR